MYDDRQSQPERKATREPLTEINPPPKPGEPQLGVKPRRKRLSDTETESSETQPQPQIKTQRRRLLETSESGSEEAPPQPPSPPRPSHPRSVDVAAAPDGQELRPRVGRPRITITQAVDDMPGLQNILDPPRSVNDLPALGRADAARSIAELQTRQNFSVAAVGGLATALVGAMVWALLAATTSYQLGWMAVGMGLLVGGAVRVLGRGMDKSFGCLGAAISVFGCLLGNFLSICTAIAGQEGLSPQTVVTHICGNPAMIPGAMLATFHSMDLLFYGIAIYAGYRFSFHRATETEISPVTCRH
jgi:hypothetical protein